MFPVVSIIRPLLGLKRLFFYPNRGLCRLGCVIFFLEYKQMEIGENCEEFGASPKMKFLSLGRNVFRKRQHLHFSVEEIKGIKII